MTLIKSISGIRGTIGGLPGDNLTPIDIVKFANAYAQWLIERNVGSTVIIGRDARISGQMVSNLVASTLNSRGLNVIDLGLSTTPTVEMAVTELNGGGGIILTASHNPKQWNALKLLNEKGEFINAAEGQIILDYAERTDTVFAEVDHLGNYSLNGDMLNRHIEHILNMEWVDIEAIKAANFKIVVDGVNSTGGIAIPALLEKLGVEVIPLFCEPTGLFPHNPEPLPEHLSELSSVVNRQNAHLGIVVDPDVDRLAFVCEDGSMFGEEYTLVAIADFILQHKKGPTVSNLSSTRALRDVTEKHGCAYHASAVGEVNVVTKMKEVGAVIGGEGNGGIIVPDLHYGRDALVGVALFLTHLAHSKMSCSQLRATYPNYIIAKNKIELTPDIDMDALLNAMEERYQSETINRIDGLKIEWESDWAHLRKSNTEAIIRLYVESESEVIAENIAKKIKSDISEILNA